MLLKLPQKNAWSQAHPFTITSRCSENFLKITVRRIGDFTTALHAVTTPADVQVAGPLGEYAKKIDEDQKIVFIAGGIGITPFISLLMHLDKEKSTAQITLFWANNRLEEFFALDMLNDLSKRIKIKIILVVFESGNENTLNRFNFICKTGHLTTKIVEEFTDGRDTGFYMCGSENIQKYVFSQIKKLGILPESVETEKIGIFMKNS